MIKSIWEKYKAFKKSLEWKCPHCECDYNNKLGICFYCLENDTDFYLGYSKTSKIIPFEKTASNGYGFDFFPNAERNDN